MTVSVGEKAQGRLSTSLGRAIGILKCFERDGEELGISELARRTGIHASTVHRFASTLEHHGYLEQRADSGRYRLGLGILELSRVVMNGIPLRRLTLPHLASLAMKTAANANLAIRWHDAVMYLARVPSPRLQDTYFHPGRKASLYATALGKVLLAALPRETRETTLSHLHLHPLTQNTIVDGMAFLEHLEEVGVRGYAIDREESLPGSHCIAAPVRGADGEVIGAMSLSTTLLDMTPEQLLERLHDLLDAARAASYNMGSHRP